jgi:hypothetical protein
MIFWRKFIKKKNNSSRSIPEINPRALRKELEEKTEESFSHFRVARFASWQKARCIMLD